MDTSPINVQDPVELNRYGYTANNPVNAVDPSGLTAVVGYAKKQSTIDFRSIALLTALTGSVVCVYKLSSSFIGAATEKVLFGGSITLDATTPPCEVQRKPATCDDAPYNNYMPCSRIPSRYKFWGYEKGKGPTSTDMAKSWLQSLGYSSVRVNNRRTATNAGACHRGPYKKGTHFMLFATGPTGRQGLDIASGIECECCTELGGKPTIMTACELRDFKRDRDVLPYQYDSLNQSGFPTFP